MKVKWLIIYQIRIDVHISKVAIYLYTTFLKKKLLNSSITKQGEKKKQKNEVQKYKLRLSVRGR